MLQKDTLHIVRSIFLWRGTAYQRIGLQNHGDRPASFDLTLLFDNDFADLFEVRGERRPRRGVGSSKLLGPTDVVLEYSGLDGAIARHRAAFRSAADAAVGECRDLSFRSGAEAGRPRCSSRCPATSRSCTSRRAFFRGLLAHRREMRRSTAGAASIETSNNIFNEVLCQAMADLNMLMTETPQGRYPYAGIPWYSTTFGRDGLITALQMLWVDPRIAAGVLKRLAFFQAKAVDPLADAEPGKILHEMRGGEMAALARGAVRAILRQRRFDAAVRAAGRPLFRAHRRRGDARGVVAVRSRRRCNGSTAPAIPMATALSNIGARPSRGLPTRAGRIPSTRSSTPTARWPRATSRCARCRAMCLPPSGWRRAARGASAFADRAEQARGRSASFCANGSRQAFWCEELGTYALALDGAKQPCRVRTSNAGQLLFTGIVREDRARRVAADLMSQQFFSGWGIRTVARGEARYNPMSYHNGSIWPHDNALIALGFARYGLKHSVAHLFKGLFDAASYMDLRRLPELFCGFQRERRRGPVLYPVACAPQAWASATAFTLLEAALGLEFDAARGEIRLRDPRLPEFLNEVVLRDLRLGASSVDLRLRRHDDEVSLEVLRTRGQIQVSIVLTH